MRRYRFFLVSGTNDKLRQFSVIIRQLCEEGPEIADALATTIQEARSINNSLQQNQDTVEKGTSHAAKRRRMSGKDLSYRPPKSAKVKTADFSSMRDSGPPETGEIHSPVEDPAANGT